MTDRRPPIAPALAALAARAALAADTTDVAVWMAIREVAWTRDSSTDLDVPSVARTCDLTAFEVRQTLARLFAAGSLESLGGRVVRVLPWPTRPADPDEVDAPEITGVPADVDLFADHFDDGFTPDDYARLIPALARPRRLRTDLADAEPWPFDAPDPYADEDEDAYADEDTDGDAYAYVGPSIRPASVYEVNAPLLDALPDLDPVYQDVATTGAVEALARAGLLDAMCADPAIRAALGLPPLDPTDA